jgi:serine protease AprX
MDPIGSGIKAEQLKENLTKDGKVKVIISAKDPKALESLKDSFLESSPGNKVTKDLNLINAFAAEVAPDSPWLKANRQKMHGYRVSLDNEIRIPPEPKPELIDPRPKLDVAMPTLNLKGVWDQGITGKGVTIAVVDTGIAQHKDIKDRIIGFNDEVNQKTTAYDDQGHGTHCTGDAAGSGAASEGKYMGPAYEASLVGSKVLDANGSGSFSDVIAGIEWAVQNKDKYNIRVMSMSLGGSAEGSYKDDPVCQAVEKAWDAGIVVVIAAGNSGPGAKTVGTPGMDPKIITVGAFDDRGTPSKEDDKMAYFSSRGPTPYDGLTKPDVISPGVNIMSCSNKGDTYKSSSGTSMATPIVAGICALIVSANQDLKPDQVKEILMKSADKMPNTNPNDAGAGVINPEKAVKMALALKDGAAA